MMDEMADINRQSDIRIVVEDLVLERRRQKLLAEASEIRKGRTLAFAHQNLSERIEMRDRAVLDSCVIFALYFEEDASSESSKSSK
jgi:hypothetical protein